MVLGPSMAFKPIISVHYSIAQHAARGRFAMILSSPWFMVHVSRFWKSLWFLRRQPTTKQHRDLRLSIQPVVMSSPVGDIHG
jgi:hypothetical protein